MRSPRLLAALCLLLAASCRLGAAARHGKTPPMETHFALSEARRSESPPRYYTINLRVEISLPVSHDSSLISGEERFSKQQLHTPDVLTLGSVWDEGLGLLLMMNMGGPQNSNDGLFGRCQAPHLPPLRYRVSAPELRELQELLRELMAQGLTWRDGATQAIVGRELSRVPAAGARYDEEQ
ncbi:Receptor-type tyrosine-protein phosphatase N2 [Liparis tanakae]|uniref:Receptor-type tyrosine-protein phosphatase N2 n=1 Tax=Liparis tanakae TaxID=230148 RepID=A0A4Z2F8C5_9TELE|nr:Receptor-type tyrosine-protein phosphatase N2 [Liparis tanakae]